MKTHESPYKCHLFVCVKSRGGDRKSCADGGNATLREQLKDEVRTRGWKGRVRVSESSCLGVCDAGPNIMVYPQKIWWSEVAATDIPHIMETVGNLIAD